MTLLQWRHFVNWWRATFDSRSVCKHMAWSHRNMLWTIFFLFFEGCSKSIAQNPKLRHILSQLERKQSRTHSSLRKPYVMITCFLSCEKIENICAKSNRSWKRQEQYHHAQTFFEGKNLDIKLMLVTRSANQREVAGPQLLDYIHRSEEDRLALSIRCKTW